MKVISFVQGKGGAGKTLLSVNVACELALRGKRVALIDNDVQGSTVEWDAIRQMIARDSRRAVYGKPFPEVFDHRDRFDGVPDGFDFAVIDTQGHIGERTFPAIRASDVAVIPVRPSTSDVTAALDTGEIVTRLGVKAAGFLLSQCRSDSMAKAVRKALKAQNAFPVLNAYTAIRVDFPRAMNEGLSVVHSKPSSLAATEIRWATDAILRLCQKTK